jgi:hypothetical protein
MKTENKTSWWNQPVTHKKSTLFIIMAGMLLIGYFLPIVLKNNDIDIPGYVDF